MACAVGLACIARVTIDQLRAQGFRRLELWSRGVDADLFTPERRSAAWRARLGAAPDDMLVIYVGRLAREKKLDRLAAALGRLTGVHVAVVGTGPDEDRLKNVFAGLPVTFTGVLRGTDLAAAYAASDVFAFPSDTDTFGNVVLEAMASGLPVVATTVGGQTDLISHGTTGLLFAPDDVDQFAAHIARYRDDVLLRSTHGAAGLAIARARTWPQQVDLLVQHYLAAMQAQPDGAGARPVNPLGVTVASGE
jgi:phosphatidylinositol alpha 1,6-mannosyltransferase